MVVTDSIAVVCAHLRVAPTIEYAGGRRGWAGDSPLIHLDCERVRALGWAPSLNIRESIGRTLEWFDANPYVWTDLVAAEARIR